MPNIKWTKDTRRYKGTATISGKKYRTVMDGTVQRFKSNRVISVILDSASAGLKLDLNEIWIMAQNGCYSKEEMMELYRLIGYSVCGFSEVFAQCSVESSLWKKS